MNILSKIRKNTCGENAGKSGSKRSDAVETGTGKKRKVLC